MADQTMPTDNTRARRPGAAARSRSMSQPQDAADTPGYEEEPVPHTVSDDLDGYDEFADPVTNGDLLEDAFDEEEPFDVGDETIPRRIAASERETRSASLQEDHELLVLLARRAAASPSRGAAVALMAAAAPIALRLHPTHYRPLRPMLPALIHGSALLTRQLYSRRATRPLIEQMPTILQHTLHALIQQADLGRTLTPATVHRILSAQAHRLMARGQKRRPRQRAGRGGNQYSAVDRRDDDES